MNHFVHDEEVDLLRRSVSCAVILEQAGWRLDATASTKRALKYRRGPAEILIVSHEDKGWWNPLGDEKGDCFDLVQFLEPELNFGHVRKRLRQIAGVVPSRQPADRGRPTHRSDPDVAPDVRWQTKPALTPSKPAWTYLADERRLPADILRAASAQDCVRAGGYGSAWFAHRDHDGQVTGIEARGPTYRGILRGGEKTLFRFRSCQDGLVRRLAVTEAPINALSMAAIEQGRGDTLYIATAGGMGPGTIAALIKALIDLALVHGTLVIATDADTAGDRHAARIEALVGDRPITVERILPPGGVNDWNDVLKSGRRGP